MFLVENNLKKVNLSYTFDGLKIDEGIHNYYNNC